MTENDEKQRMKDVDHTHPYGDRSAGALFARGPVVAADGGQHTEDGKRMKDVDHTPPHDEEGASRVFERGEECPDDGKAVVEK